MHAWIDGGGSEPGFGHTGSYVLLWEISLLSRLVTSIIMVIINMVLWQRTRWLAS